MASHFATESSSLMNWGPKVHPSIMRDFKDDLLMAMISLIEAAV